MLIYLASPYTHPSSAIRQARFEAVCEVAGRLMKKGLHVFSPIAHTHCIALMAGLPSDIRYWQEYDTKILSRCDELWVCTLDGWLQSSGVEFEINLARKIPIPVRMIGIHDSEPHPKQRSASASSPHR